MPHERSSKLRQRFPLESLVLDETTAEPLYRQLETQIRSAILDGRLAAGERMPSTRRLADDLGVARNTAKTAYNQLIVEGYLVTAAGSGTRVAKDLPESLLHRPSGRRQSDASPLALSPIGKRIAKFSGWLSAEVGRPCRPFLPHVPAFDAFPSDVWTRLTMRRLRQPTLSLLDRGDARGLRPLREAIAGYLGSARGVSCSAEQVIVTAGAQQAIELIAKLLIEPGDHVCMEDPGYTPARVLFELAGAKVTAVPVDDEGLDVRHLETSVPRAKLVYVTPSAQFPMGMTMSLARRLALIRWAERSGAVILEDDYNGEYRYAGRPLPALHGLAASGRALYTGSFSKLLFPSLRIGYLVVPEGAIDCFAAARWLVDRHSPPLEQSVLADFIEEGHFARHVRRMRTLYAERQEKLVESVASELGGVLDVPAADAGLHLVGRIDKSVDEVALLQAGESADVVLTPTSLFSVRAPTERHVILGYAPFTAREIDRATKSLARAWEAAR